MDEVEQGVEAPLDPEEENNEVEEDDLLATLRAKRRAIVSAKHVTLEIPGFDGLLWARYNRIPWEDVKRIADKAAKSRAPRKELMAHCDVLIEAVDCILIRKDDDLEPINNAYPEFGEEPVRFDNRLAAALGFQPQDTARKTVLAAFSNNGLAVTAQQADLVEAIQQNRSEDEEDFSNS